MVNSGRPPRWVAGWLAVAAALPLLLQAGCSSKGGEEAVCDSAAACDDGNACTLDRCDPDVGCSSTPVLSFACRPQIEVTAPARGATLQGAQPGEVLVTGTVTSGAGLITELRVNGVAATVGEAGAFSATIVPLPGGNALVIDATDATGFTARRVQSFLWSSEYLMPDGAQPTGAMVAEGMGVRVGPEVIDDGDRGLPADDAGTFIEQGLAGLLEEMLDAKLREQLAPMFHGLLAQLAVDQGTAITGLFGGPTLSVRRQSDFAAADFTTDGGVLRLRTTAFSDATAPFANLGVPGRVGCGAGPQQLMLPGVAELELALSDDAVNQQLHAAWRGGLLQASVPPEFIDLSGYPASDASMELTGMLAPTATDCGPDGAWQATIGDLRVDLSLTYDGEPVDAVAWVTLTTTLVPEVAGPNLDIFLPALVRQVSEVQVQTESALDHEAALRTLIERFVSDSLVPALGVLPLASMPLPALDATLVNGGLPPGTGLRMAPGSVTRGSGESLVAGPAEGL